MDEADQLIVKDTSTQEARLEVQYVNYLLDSDPHNPHLWFRKALRFQNAMVGSISEKVSLETTLLWYKQCLTDWPSLWAVHHNRAVVLRKLNRYQEALEAARQSVELNPKNKVGWELMAATLVRLGRQREAHRVFAEAAKVGVQLNPEIIGLTNSEKVDDERDRRRKQTDPGLVKE